MRKRDILRKLMKTDAEWVDGFDKRMEKYRKGYESKEASTRNQKNDTAQPYRQG